MNTLNVGDITREHFLITAKDKVERKGKKINYFNLKCKKCGQEIKMIQGNLLSYYCKKHDNECTGSPYSIGAAVAASKESSTTGIGNSTNIKTTKTGGVDLSKFRKVEIPDKAKPGSAKTEKGSNFYDGEIDKVIVTMVRMERGRNLMKLETVDNEKKIASECKLLYNRLEKEGILCPTWAVNYDTFKEWYKKNIPEMPNSFQKYRIYLARKDDNKLLSPDNVIIGCFSVLN